VPRQVFASPSAGVSAFIEDEGEQIPGLVRYFVEIYEPGEALPAKVETLAKVKARWLDPLTGALRIPFGRTVFTIGPDLVQGLPDNTPVQVKFTHQPLASRPKDPNFRPGR
jgi:hypothetical protein